MQLILIEKQMTGIGGGLMKKTGIMKESIGNAWKLTKIERKLTGMRQEVTKTGDQVTGIEWKWPESDWNTEK
jgi:hypothetical protein